MRPVSPVAKEYCALNASTEEDNGGMARMRFVWLIHIIVVGHRLITAGGFWYRSVEGARRGCGKAEREAVVLTVSDAPL